MNYKLITYGGGGIFSIFMDLVLMNAYTLKADKFYIYIRNNQYNPLEDCFSFVFNQHLDNTYRKIRCKNKQGFRKKNMYRGTIEDFKDLALIKKFCRKFDIKKEILDRIINIPKNTLGIHFRGGDMDRKHPQFGIFNYTHYREQVYRMQFDNIFIASDNDAVIEKIKADFGDIPIYYYNFIRARTEEQDTYKVQLDNMNKPLFWQEAFIDMLTLSKCDSLLCRTSGLANAAIAFSDTLKNIHRL